MISSKHRLPGYRIPEILKTKHTIIRGKIIDVHCQTRSDDKPMRITVVCPVKLSKKAVKRNRTKRIIRELIRLHVNTEKTNLDCVILANTLLDTITSEEKEKVLETTLKAAITV